MQHSPIIQWFQDNPLVSIVFTVIGIILGIWSVILSIKSGRKKSLSYSSENNNLIQDFSEKFNGLNIQFNNQAISNFSVYKIAIWNSGNVTLNKSDIVSADPLRIEGKNILNYEIIKHTEDSNQVQLKSGQINDTQGILLDFDYLDAGDGVLIQIFHSSVVEEIHFTGKLKGVKKLTIRGEYPFEPSRMSALIRIINCFLPLAILFEIWQTPLSHNTILNTIVNIIATIVFVPISFILFYRLLSFRKLPKKLFFKKS